MASKTKKKGRLTSGLNAFIAAVEMLSEGINDPSFKQYIANYIARDAIRRAQNNIYNGGNPTHPHSQYTPELTENLRGGETQAVLMETGKMAESIKIVVSTVYFGKVIVEIGINDLEVAKYAAVQEYGAIVTKGPVHSIIEPRPFLTPAVQDAAYEAASDPKLKKIIDLAVTSMFNGEDWKKHFR